MFQSPPTSISYISHRFPIISRPFGDDFPIKNHGFDANFDGKALCRGLPLGLPLGLGVLRADSSELPGLGTATPEEWREIQPNMGLLGGFIVNLL